MIQQGLAFIYMTKQSSLQFCGSASALLAALAAAACVFHACCLLRVIFGYLLLLAAESVCYPGDICVFV
jgi:hypothetical protein